MSTKLLTSCHIISPDFEAFDAAVLIDGDTIKRVYVDSTDLPQADEVIDIGGNMLMPGFIDTHCHGRSGYDFSDANLEGLTKICVDILSEGVTTLLPTTLTLPEEQLAAALRTADEYVKAGSVGCRVPGVHLEGPFINPKCCGAQNPDFVRLPDIEEVKRLHKIFPVTKISYAVEMKGGAKFAEELLAEGITPSCVHSAATYAQFLEGNAYGLRSLTHFCNQMTPLKHREIGLVGAGLLHEDVYLELICDTLHVCPDMIRLIFQTRDCDHLMLITDSVEASGMPEGEYELAGLPIVLKDGAVHVKGHPETLGGSVLTMNAAFRNVCEITGYPLKDLVKTTSWNQARALGLERVGRIEPGYLADLTILSGDFEVERVFVNGEERYSAEE